MTKAHQLLRESTYDAVALLKKVVDDEEASYGYRLSAAHEILERTLPRNQNYNLTIGLDTEPLFMKILRNSVLSLVPGELEAGPDIIDIEYTDTDEISWDS